MPGNRASLNPRMAAPFESGQAPGLYRRPLTRRFGLTGLESGDPLAGSADDLGEQLFTVVDPEGRVGFLDGDGPAGVADPDLDFLPGDADAAAATDPPVNFERCGSRCRCGSTGTSR
jgi:hypothetical protein